MVAVQKIRKDAFLILWRAENPSYFAGSSETNFIINEISQSVQLTYKIDSSGNSNSILEMEIVPLKEGRKCKTLKPATVLAINSSVEKTMEFQNSKWTTTFSEMCACGQRTNSKRPLYLHLYIFIDFDPTNKMFQQPSCGCGRPGLIFNAMIDFNMSLKKLKSDRVNVNLLNMWETKTLADVTFKFQEKEIKAHTLILASGSPVLAAMFQNDFKEKQEKIVQINDVKFDVFKKMLQFFYTGYADVNTLDVADLLVVANKYGVDSLKVDCANFMSWRLTIDNVIYCLVLSHLHESPHLHKSALEFISRNAQVIVLRKDWEDLMKNHHQLCLAAVKVIVLAKKNPNQ